MDAKERRDPDLTGLLGVSVATVERAWQAARAWLYARLTGASA